MRVLVLFESSGIVRNAFSNLGHDAFSVDLKPAEDGEDLFHLRGDCTAFSREWLSRTFDLVIAHPPCQYISASGMHWTRRGLRDPQLTEMALDVFNWCLQLPVEHICVENPVGVASTRIRKPEQYIQPYSFGENASKKTGLWLKNLPRLAPTDYVEPRWVRHPDGHLVPRWANQTDSGQNKLPPSEKRATDRSRTYPGIANAMAQQWTHYIESSHA